MPTIQIPAENATLVLNGSVLGDMSEGDYLELRPVNPLTEHTNGSNGSVTINKRLDSGVHELVFRVIKFSESDSILNSWRNQASLVVLDGSLSESFIRDGVEGVESHLLESGSITTQPTNTKNNQTVNALMEYTIRFRTVTRSI